MPVLCRLCLIVVALFFVPAARAEAPFDFAATPGDLPKDVRPIAYALHLVPDLAARRFRATQRVQIEVLKPVARIVMHAVGLEIGPATLSGGGLPRFTLPSPVADAKRQTIAFALPRMLRPGRYRLEMAWAGKINSTPEAIFIDRYREGGAERSLLATDMEPTGTRRLMPCWDEPAFRARFRVSADLPAAFTAYSNMPVRARRALPGGLRRTSFATTPAMPSYLLTLAAGDFEQLQGRAGTTRLGIVATRGKLGSAGFALAASAELLPYYNRYFGLPFPLPKLDHIALPGGFSGAMENWGAIVYTESALLSNPASTSETERQGVYSGVAHEMAHQWFGNLVTMAWWDDLWLNEAFANWMAVRASERFHPEWRPRLAENAGRERAMALDSRATTHPVRRPVADAADAEDAFDSITYDKGASFLRMLEAYLGEDTFRSGIRAYMARHRYANTTGADLWAALGRAAGGPVDAIANDWITQPGFPLIDADARCEAGRRIVTLRQSPFSADASAVPAETRWRVPVMLGSSAGPATTTTLLEAPLAEVALPGCAGALVIDPGNVGYFRVRYAPALREPLAAAWPSLPDGARQKLLADTGALMFSGRADLASFIGLARRLGGEPRRAIWAGLLADLRSLDRLSRGEPANAQLQRASLEILRPRFAGLGWDERPGESEEERGLRALLARALADAGDESVIAEGRARFARFVAEPKSVPAAQIGAIVYIAGSHADAASFDELKSLAEAAPASADKERYYNALAAVRDPALAERALALALDPTVPQLMRTRIVGEVAAGGHADLAWAFARDHVAALLADLRVYDGGKTFGRIAAASASAERADELDAFAKTSLPESARTEILQAEDEIRTRARTRARLQPQWAGALGSQ